MSASILITGSSRGIGRAVALGLAEDGFDIVVHCRSRRKEAEQVAAAVGISKGTLYARHLQPIMGIPALVLPSTSPANAIWTLPKLTDAWRKALTGENATFCE